MSSLRRGAVLDLPPSPMPQAEVPGKVVPVEVTHGFFQTLPESGTNFLNRIFFKVIPKPLFVGTLPPYPFPIPILKLVVPPQQGWILKHFSFKVFQNTGIGVEDIVEVPPSRVTTYFAFEVKIDNRGIYDFATNVNARGQAINYGGAGNSTNNIAPPTPTPGQGTLFPFAGENQPVGDQFATYAVSGQLIELTAYILKEPEFEARSVSAQCDGINLNQVDLQKILRRIVRGNP